MDIAQQCSHAILQLEKKTQFIVKVRQEVFSPHTATNSNHRHLKYDSVYWGIKNIELFTINHVSMNIH